MIEMHHWAFIVQWSVWSVGILALAVIALRNQIRAEELADEVLSAHEWIDEIIKALESEDDDELEALLKERVED